MALVLAWALVLALALVMALVTVSALLEAAEEVGTGLMVVVEGQILSRSAWTPAPVAFYRKRKG